MIRFSHALERAMETRNKDRENLELVVISSRNVY